MVEPKISWGLHNPIIILTTGRSGSSAVAGIFHHHGVWSGKSLLVNRFNPKGFFENAKIRQAIYEWFGKDWVGKIPEPRKGWKEEVVKIITSQNVSPPWMMKHGAFYHNIWDEFEPVTVGIKWCREKIYQEFQKSGFLKRYAPKEAAFIINRQLEMMDTDHTIDFQRLIDGDDSEIKSVLESLGFEYNREITEYFIDEIN